MAGGSADASWAGRLEDISADDDLLSDMLLDKLEFEPIISTNKMNQAYRSPRFDTNAVVEMIRRRVIIERDVASAVKDLCELTVVRKHLQGKPPRQQQAFQSHARRYLEAYLPDTGFEFAITNRYQRSIAPLASSLPDASDLAESSAAGAAAAAAAQSSGRGTATAKSKGRRSGDAGPSAALSNKADLCVIAVKAFDRKDIIRCKGGVKDLTKDEDEALRNEAAATRAGGSKSGRDFSIIKSSMKNCSQLLLGPARFVNHDCVPNVQFHRDGTNMMFKVLRPIAVNEEVLVGYGEHYFGWNNSECLCGTCEAQGNGAFAKEGIDSLQEKEEKAAAAATSPSPEQEAPRDGRRVPSRRRKGARESPTNGTNGSRHLDDDRRSTSTSRSPSGVRNDVAFSDREMIDPSLAVGPKCQCKTCGAPFFALEKWWKPDECQRCERHYRIFKADWPSRQPTEGKYAALSQQVQREKKSNGNDHAAAEGSTATKGKGKASLKVQAGKAKGRGASTKAVAIPSTPNSSGDDSSEASTPIRLTPLRPDEPTDDHGPSKSDKNGRAQADATDAAAKKTAGRSSKAQSTATKAPSTASESELTEQSISEADAASARIDRTVSPHNGASSGNSSDSDRPRGPKMLGKEAKTETLANFWGIQDGESKRVRKQSMNGPVSLAGRLGTSSGPKRSGSGHGRTVSSASRASVFAPDSDDDEEANRTETCNARSSTSVDRKPPLAAPTGSASASPTKPVAASPALGSPMHSVDYSETETSISSKGKSKAGRSKKGYVDVEEDEVAPASPGSTVIATQGPQRTSISNLAAHWSAGIEGSRRSRKQAQRDPTLTHGSHSASPKRGRESSGSAAPSPSSSSLAGPKRARHAPAAGSSLADVASSNSYASPHHLPSPKTTMVFDESRRSTHSETSSLAGEEATPRPRSPGRSSPLPSRLGPGNASSSASHHQGVHAESPHITWPGVSQGSTSGSASPTFHAGSPSSTSVGSYSRVPGRKNLRIGQAGTASRPPPSQAALPSAMATSNSSMGSSTSGAGWPGAFSVSSGPAMASALAVSAPAAPAISTPAVLSVSGLQAAPSPLAHSIKAEDQIEPQQNGRKDSSATDVADVASSVEKTSLATTPLPTTSAENEMNGDHEMVDGTKPPSKTEDS